MGGGLRERKKQATRDALREAALRLALERGAGNVRVDDIAEAAGVSPRTYNNYFASREQAIVAAVVANRDARIAAAVAAQPPDVLLSDAVIEAVVTQYCDPRAHDPRLLSLLTSHPPLRSAFLARATQIDDALSDVLAERLGSTDALTPRVLATSVAAAIRIALRQWLEPVGASGGSAGFVVPSGSLSELLRRSLAPLRPALDVAGEMHGPARAGPHRP
jgi:AcrR family transcriptional regulator